VVFRAGLDALGKIKLPLPEIGPRIVQPKLVNIPTALSLILTGAERNVLLIEVLLFSKVNPPSFATVLVTLPFGYEDYRRLWYDAMSEEHTAFMLMVVRIHCPGGGGSSCRRNSDMCIPNYKTLIPEDSNFHKICLRIMRLLWPNLKCNCL
jgi:hypothetical protein